MSPVLAQLASACSQKKQAINIDLGKKNQTNTYQST